MYSPKERGLFMPIVTVQLLEGRTDEQKRALVEKVTDAVSETTGAPKERVSIIISEMKPNDYGVAGKRPSDQNEQ
ncbi:2-hydroxymuconate tautomerase [Shouchella tritolerans]|uniref:2-hydroxymuconate tautomerase n=1 Tax=Shouchella tritolerans TaxID=2979466 RepID=UPI0009EEB641|nr:2-hydroxymuconate tautomerase [Shouchella tritolerans]